MDKNLNDYVLLRAENTRLLLLQEQMLRIAHIHDRHQVGDYLASDAETLMSGIADKKPLFVALSETLTLLPYMPEGRYVQTTWQITPDVHWSWSEVRLLNQISIVKQPVPVSIRTSHMPVDGIVTLSDGTVALSCDSSALLQYIISGEQK